MSNEEILREALVGIVGADGKKELEEMHKYLSTFIQTNDVKRAITAVDALIKTLPENKT